MPEYVVRIRKSAFKELRKIPPKDFKKIEKILTSLAENPRPRGCIKLKSGDDFWRIRSGHFRII